MSEQPTDLITAKEAAVMADRTKASIRGWVRKGLLEGFRQDPEKTNSALMISKEALLIFLAQTNKQNKTGRPLAIENNPETSIDDAKTNKPTTENSENMNLMLEKQKLQAQIDNLQAEKQLLREIIAQQKQTIDQAKRIEEHLIDARKQVERELEYQRTATVICNEKLANLENKNQQLMVYLTLPWWRRMGNPVPMLTQKSAG